ncbi:hypothetical protein ABEF95_016282 [Exophiala dermatitidis]
MATRRNVPAEKTISEAQGGPSTSTQVSDTSPAVPASVIYKLLGFTMAMIFFPIGSYFLSVNLVFGGKEISCPSAPAVRYLHTDTSNSLGNATYAGAFAAIMANVVLVAYIIVAMKEDQTDKIEAGKKGKKTQ